MKKIDIHCHTTNRPLKDNIIENASIEAILALMNEHDVSNTVLLATYFPHKQTGISNYRLLNWIESNKIKYTTEGNKEYKETNIINTKKEAKNNLLMFGSLDFEHYYYQGLNELEELIQNNKLSGIKIYTTYQNIDLHSKKFLDVINLASLNSLPVMFHTGVSYTAYRKYGKDAINNIITPKNLEHLFINYPDTKFILSHMSKPHTTELIEIIKKYQNTYTDVSGLIDSKYNRDEIPEVLEDVNQFLGECGPKRLLFGTDFPVQSHEDSIYFVENSMKNYSYKDKEDVYYNNAWRLLK